jgi:hypothetical protein
VLDGIEGILELGDLHGAERRVDYGIPNLVDSFREPGVSVS